MFSMKLMPTRDNGWVRITKKMDVFFSSAYLNVNSILIYCVDFFYHYLFFHATYQNNPQTNKKIQTIIQITNKCKNNNKLPHKLQITNQPKTKDHCQRGKL